MKREYTVIYEPGGSNWSAYVPDLPGCIASGRTRDDVKNQIREAIEFHIEGLRLNGEPVPEPTVEAATVTSYALRFDQIAEEAIRDVNDKLRPFVFPVLQIDF